MSGWTIRPEAPGDEQAIAEIITAAFANMPFSDGGEAQLVDRLRADGDLALSLVASDGAAIIGHIGFSQITVGGQTGQWFQLAPLAVAPAHQQGGVGSSLAQAGIAAMRGKGAQGIGVLGEPAYYERFGFIRQNGIGMNSPHDEYYRWLTLDRDAPTGTVTFAPAFG